MDNYEIKVLINERISKILAAEEAERKARAEALEREIRQYKADIQNAIRNTIKTVEKLDTWYHVSLPSMPKAINSQQRTDFIETFLSDKRIVWINDAYLNSDGINIKIKV